MMTKTNQAVYDFIVRRGVLKNPEESKGGLVMREILDKIPLARPGVGNAEWIAEAYQYPFDIGLLGGRNEQSIRGKLFERLVIAAAVADGMLPLHAQMGLKQAPVAKFDLAWWVDGSSPVSMSLKTSLRERWREPVLESDHLKLAYRKAKTFLLTWDRTDYERVRKDAVHYDISLELLRVGSDRFASVWEWLRDNKFVVKHENDHIKPGVVIMKPAVMMLV
jgi:hypothetical protein